MRHERDNGTRIVVQQHGLGTLYQAVRRLSGNEVLAPRPRRQLAGHGHREKIFPRQVGMHPHSGSVDGTVATVRVMTDRDTGCARGFGFVEMPDATEAQAAIDGLQRATLGARALRVNEARPRSDQAALRTTLLDSYSQQEQGHRNAAT